MPRRSKRKCRFIKGMFGLPSNTTLVPQAKTSGLSACAAFIVRKSPVRLQFMQMVPSPRAP